MSNQTECTRCGATFKKLPRGRIPKFCPPCRKEHNAEKARAKRRELSQDEQWMEKKQARSRDYYKKRRQDDQWLEERRAHGRDHQRYRKFGLRPEDYRRMLHEQGDVCAICFRLERVKRRGRVLALAVDHDHTSGRIRGLLCQECNRALGCFEKHDGGLQSLVRYINAHYCD
jgi:uncharacterized Zn finger protein (UPF0148 family)